ncbi:hypothetical protein KCMC57_up58600 [Kitasatospora sp. CMC57]|uniref:Uncharacterized protein n=1 Tax=Kitasatospora sp. CMC57 TaxID=3231513 RepID=A0AB33K7M7_9ACTN
MGRAAARPSRCPLHVGEVQDAREGFEDLRGGAWKAAVHAYSEALRVQLDGTGVSVVELVPRRSQRQGRRR